MTPKPLDLGTLFDVAADRGVPTEVRLSRPFDLAPDGGVDWRMPGLAELVRDTAGALRAAGAGPGETVAIVKANHWDHVLLACAAARIGAVPALLSAALPADVLPVLLKRLDPAVLVTDAAVLSTVDVTGLARRTVALSGAPAGTVSMDELRGHRPPPPYRRRDDEPLIVHHTSGTTGCPKLVVHSTRTIIRRLAGFEAVRWPVLAARRTDTVASAIAFNHGRAVPWSVSTCWLGPRRMLLVADRDPAVAGPVLRACPPTVLETDPATYVRWTPLTAGADGPFRDVRLYVSTFDATHPPTVRSYLAASRRRMPIWMQGWGQTETGPLTFRFLTRRSLTARGRRHPTTRDLGRPVPGRTRLRIVDEHTFAPVPDGRPGLVLARTEARCLGYVAEQDRWDDKVDGPWWNTGDVGVLSGGTLRLLDREVDRVPGVSCLEVEDVLEDRLAGVVEATVLAMPRGPALPVLVTGDGRLDRTAWLAATTDLPPLAEPVVLTWDELPRTATGKVRRATLRERLRAATRGHGTGRWT
ncbi:MAG TPA: class I adenylate-forming enzyme family protein [Actinocatenispora sp.]